MKTIGILVAFSFLSGFLTLQNALSQEVQKESSGPIQKQFAIAMKYNNVTNIHSTLDTTFGNQFSFTDESPSASFLGLGATYTFPFSESFNFKTGLFLMGASQKLFNFENGVLTQLIGYVAYRLGDHGVFFGPNVQQIMVVKPLTYQPAVGVGFGYQYFFNSEVSIDAGFELVALKSENSAGGITLQRIEFRTYTATLSYYLF